MSHFAELDALNCVMRVIVAEQDFMNTLPGRWIQTSYSGSFRGKFAGIGDLYDPALDRFIPPVERTPIPTPTANVPL